jgi:hypothetical protein
MGGGAKCVGEFQQGVVVLDSRLPYADFRELFTLKNYWKTVKRNDKSCGKCLLFKFVIFS